MLDGCAPGHERLATVYHWRICYGGRSYPNLPRGAHGRRKSPSVQVGHVRRMARALGISDCAKGQIEGL